MLSCLFLIGVLQSLERNGLTYELNSDGIATFQNSSLEEVHLERKFIYNGTEYELTIISPVQNSIIKVLWIPSTVITINEITKLSNLQQIQFIDPSETEIGFVDIGEKWFDGSTITGKVTIPKTVENIGNYAFRNTKIESLVFKSDDYISIGKYAFYGCTELKSISNFPQNANLRRSCFENCKQLNLRNKDLLNCQWDHIGAYAFRNSPLNIDFIRLHVVSIKEFAFEGSSIKKLFVEYKNDAEDGIDEGGIDEGGDDEGGDDEGGDDEGGDDESWVELMFEENCFANMQPLYKVDLIVPNDFSFQKPIFFGTDIGQLYIKTKNITSSSITFIGSTFQNTNFLSSISDSNYAQIIIISDNINFMRSCFSGTTGLRTMCIQSCLIKIDEYAFFNSSIQRFEVAQLMKMEFEEDSSGDDENKILIDDESERLSDDEGSRVDEESDEDYQPYIGIQHEKSQVVVDNYNKALNSGQIDYIAKYAFSESKLEEIVFKLKNYSINNIKKGGFKNCKYLKRIPAIFGTIFPFAISGADINTITLQAKKISTNAITYCKSLKVIIIEKTVEDLGPKFFDFCDNVETLIFADGDQLLEIKEAFQLYNFVNVNFGNRVSVIGAYAFMQSSISGTLELPAGLKVIKERAFESCKNLDGMLIFDKCNKLEYLGSGCFQACSGFIGQLKLPESVTYIGPNCFAECK